MGTGWVGGEAGYGTQTEHVTPQSITRSACAAVLHKAWRLRRREGEEGRGGGKGRREGQTWRRWVPLAALGSLEKSFMTRSWLPLSSSLSASSNTKNLTASVASLPDSMKSMMRPTKHIGLTFQHAGTKCMEFRATTFGTSTCGVLLRRTHACKTV